MSLNDRETVHEPSPFHTVAVAAAAVVVVVVVVVDVVVAVVVHVLLVSYSRTISLPRHI